MLLRFGLVENEPRPVSGDAVDEAGRARREYLYGMTWWTALEHLSFLIELNQTCDVIRAVTVRHRPIEDVLSCFCDGHFHIVDVRGF